MFEDHRLDCVFVIGLALGWMLGGAIFLAVDVVLLLVVLHALVSRHINRR